MTDLSGENIKIAIQKKGRLFQSSLDLIKASGVEFDSSDGLLFARGRNFPLDILFLRDDDIPEYVQDGVTDLGIVGLNVVLEKGAEVARLDSLGFGGCDLCVAVPKSGRFRTVWDLDGQRIATSYPNILHRFLKEKAISAKVIELNGSVEIAPGLDVAEAICDLVSTGSTLRIHELLPIETVLHSEAVLIANRNAFEDSRTREQIDRLRNRMLSHLQARKTKYVMMNAPASAIDEIRGILPGMKSPTVVPLAAPGLMAVHTAVPEATFWDVIERLKKAGATDILVVPVEKMVVWMRVFKYQDLSKEELRRLCKRNPVPDPGVMKICNEIFEAVEARGDEAVREYTLRFDGVNLADFQVSAREFQEGLDLVPARLLDAMKVACSNIRRFHAAQSLTEEPVEVLEGVVCWRAARAISSVGLYVPGGTAVLPSSVLMLAVPAKLAGCSKIVLCVPPGRDGTVAPSVLAAAQLSGVRQVFKVGGAQAIAALTCGTESVPRVEKILGPGNRYVQTAKVLATLRGVAIDMLAGPSEVLVIADEGADPGVVASDLLSQAEHGSDSQVVFLTQSAALLEAVLKQVQEQCESLPRRRYAEPSLETSMAILVNSLEQAFEFSNRYAPEHLILNLESARDYLGLVQSAGSVFVGRMTPEVAGDYASGTNHTLPTSGWARHTSGISMDSYVKKISFQELSSAGLASLEESLLELAREEGLEGHARAVRYRREKQEVR